MSTPRAYKKPRFASDRRAAARLANALQEIPDHYLDCRQFKHAWEVVDEFVPFAVKDSNVLHLKSFMECMRKCGVKRTEVYTVTRAAGLERVRSTVHYSEAPGYQLPGVPRGVKPLAIIQDERYRRHQS